MNPSLSAALAVLGVLANLTAQAGSDLEKRRTEKLAKPVFKNAAWSTEYAAARTRAAVEGRFLLTYFTRSYSP